MPAASHHAGASGSNLILGSVLAVLFVFSGILPWTTPTFASSFGISSVQPSLSKIVTVNLPLSGLIRDHSLPTEALNALPADDDSLFCHHPAPGHTPSWECQHTHPDAPLSPLSPPVGLASAAVLLGPPSPTVFSRIPGILPAKPFSLSPENPPRSLPLL